MKASVWRNRVVLLIVSTTFSVSVRPTAAQCNDPAVVLCSSSPLLHQLTSEFRQCLSRSEQQQQEHLEDLCLAPLLRRALDSVRPTFSTGLRLTDDGWPGRIEPLTVVRPADRGRSQRVRPVVSRALLSGLSTAELRQAQLNNSHASVRLSFPQLQARAQLELSGGLLPLRPHVTVNLFDVDVTVITTTNDFGNSTNSTLTSLTPPMVSLQARDFRVEISNLLRIGGSIEEKVNDASQEIIHFLTPSLESVVAARLARLQSKYSQQIDTLIRQLIS